MRSDDIGGKKNAARQILADLSGHIIALNGIDRGILVGIFLLDFLVIALDEREDLRIRRVDLTGKRAGVTVGDIFAGNGKGFLIHDLIFHEILDLFHVDRTIQIVCKRSDLVRDQFDLLFREAIALAHFRVCFPDRIENFFNVERNFRTVTFDNFHHVLLGYNSAPSPYRGKSRERKKRSEQERFYYISVLLLCQEFSTIFWQNFFQNHNM